MTEKTDRTNIPQGAVCLLLVLGLLTSSSQAQDTSRSFGTLFTTPDEREYLDYLRQEFVDKSQSASFNIDEDVIPEIPKQAEPEPQAQEITTYVFGGIMTRLNGNRMVWLNGKQTAESDLPGNMSLITTGTGTLLNIREDGRNFQLKPGQMINMQNGQVMSSYEASRPPAAPSPQTTDTDGGNDQAGAVDVQVESEGDTTLASADQDTPADSPAAPGEVATQSAQSINDVLEQLGQDSDALNDPEFRKAIEQIYEQSQNTE